MRFAKFLLACLVLMFAAACIISPVVAEEKIVSISSFDELNTNITTANGNAGNHYTFVIMDDIYASGKFDEIRGNITLMPNTGGATITRTVAQTADNSGLFTIGSGGHLTIVNNGSGVLTIDGNKTILTTNTASLIHVQSGGTFTMNGGILTNNTANPFGGGVDMNGGTFTMNGGYITNNTAKLFGGGVFNYEGTFTMNEGTIDKNTAEGGGGVYNNDTFTMNGGTIDKNTALEGGGVYNNDNFTISGSPKIIQNTKTDGSTASNVYLPSGEYITIVGALNAESRIGVTTQAPPTAGASVAITAPNSVNYAACFFADNEANYHIGHDEKSQQVILTWGAARHSITTPDSVEGGSITVNATALVGENVTITVTPNAGYSFSKIVINATTSMGEEKIVHIHQDDGTITFIMPAGDTTITPTFVGNSYEIKTDLIENGTVTISQTEAQYGTTVTFTATPNSGYHVADNTFVLENDTGVTSEVTPTGTENTYQFTMPIGNVTLTASFKPNTHNITIATSQNGTISVTTGIENVPYNSIVKVTVTPETGYKLHNITYTYGSTTESITGSHEFRMPDADVTIHVVFDEHLYTITENFNQAHGHVTLNVESANVNDKITIDKIEPHPGYELHNITYVSDNEPTTVHDITNDKTFVMPAGNVTVSVTFNLKEYSINNPALENGTVTINKTTANMGETISLEAIPNTGYHFIQFVVEANQSHNHPHIEVNGLTGTFTMPPDNVTVSAVFAINKYTVTWVRDDGSELKPSEEVSHGTIPTYAGTPTKEATAQYTYTFEKWKPSLETPITEDTTFTAIFTKTLNNYTITWKNYDGSVLETDTEVPYGEMPAYNGTTPTRAEDAYNTYTFEGWSPAVNTVVGNTDYTAVFTAEAKYTPHGGGSGGSGGSSTWIPETPTQTPNPTDTAPTELPTPGGTGSSGTDNETGECKIPTLPIAAGGLLILLLAILLLVILTRRRR